MLNYKGLKSIYEHLTVGEELVDHQIDRLLEQNRRTIQITDRATQTGDEVIIDFTGYCDGKPFEGGHAEKYALTLGSGAFIPGFEEQLIGRHIGDDVLVEVTFPDGYPAEALAGRKATFQCKLHEIRIHARYDDSDAFAREVGDCADMKEFREQVRASLQRYVDRQADAELKDRLLNQLVEQCDAAITDEQLERALDIEMQELEAQLTQQKLTLDMYCQFMNTTAAKLREDRIPDARKNVLRQNVIAQIAEAEGIEADEQSVADAFAALCRDHSIAPEQMQMYFDERLESILVRTVIESKVLDVIRSCAEITTVEK